MWRHLVNSEVGSTLLSSPEMKIRQISLGIGFIVLGAIPELYIQYRLHAHNWTPQKFPFLLREGTLRAPDFSTDMDGAYSVNLAFQPRDAAREECLLGDRLFKDSCDKLGSGLALDWAVVRNDRRGSSPVVGPQPYTPGMFGGAGVVEVRLGEFQARRGQEYAVVLNVHNSSPELKEAAPEVRVEAGRAYWEEWVIFSQPAFLLAVVFGLIGLLIVTLSFTG
jgi:hypothetical protein